MYSKNLIEIEDREVCIRNVDVMATIVNTTPVRSIYRDGETQGIYASLYPLMEQRTYTTRSCSEVKPQERLKPIPPITQIL